MQKQKKNEIITFRTDSETKQMLEMIAERNKWSVSQVVEQLIKDFIASDCNLDK